MKVEIETTRELKDAEDKAWDALARYKFWMFGYHAAQWVMLNRVFNTKRSNPFVELVKAARERRKKL